MTKAGTSKMETDESQTSERDSEINKLISITDIIVAELGTTISTQLNNDLVKNTFDIDLSEEMSVVLMTVFTCLRKEENDNTGNDI